MRHPSELYLSLQDDGDGTAAAVSTGRRAAALCFAVLLLAAAPLLWLTADAPATSGPKAALSQDDDDNSGPGGGDGATTTRTARGRRRGRGRAAPGRRPARTRRRARATRACRPSSRRRRTRTPRRGPARPACRPSSRHRRTRTPRRGPARRARPPGADTPRVGWRACRATRSTCTPPTPPSSRSGSPRSGAARPSCSTATATTGRSSSRWRKGATASPSAARTRADVALHWDREVSRLHATIERIAGDWVLADERLSRNGTFVNGERLAARRRLAGGDVIAVGASAIAFVDPGPGSASVTAAGGVHVPAVTPAQRRVLEALCRPLADGGAPASNPAIAAELVVAVDTVKGTMSKLFELFEIGDDVPQNQKRAVLARRGRPRRRASVRPAEGGSRSPPWWRGRGARPAGPSGPCPARRSSSSPRSAP